MQYSGNQEDILLKVNHIENVKLQQMDKELWIYTRKPWRINAFMSKALLILCILIVPIVFIAFLFVILLMFLHGTIIMLLLILPMLLISALIGGFGIYHFARGTSETVITINRKAENIDVNWRTRLGSKRENHYALENFESVRFDKTIVSGGRGRSATYFTINLHGPKTRVEIFRTLFEAVAKNHARELAVFLDLDMLDETKPWDLSDASHLLWVDEGLKAILLTYTKYLECNRLHVGPKIPEWMLKKAIQTFAKRYTADETPLVLLNASSFWGTFRGALITDKHVYLSGSETDTSQKVKITEMTDRVEVVYEQLLQLGRPVKDMGRLARMLQAMAEYQNPGLTSRKEEISTIVDRYAEQIHDDRVFCHPCISRKKLQKALASFASECSDEETPLVLIDDSMFGSVKIGGLITDRYMYTHRQSKVPIAECAEHQDLLDFGWPGKHALNRIKEMVRELSSRHAF